MKLTPQKQEQYKQLCKRFRLDTVRIIHKNQTGHTGGSLSLAEILTAIYFEEGHFDPETPNENDGLVLCKGHGAPMLYQVLAEKGFFPREDLDGLRQLGSHLQGHPCSRSTPGVDVSTGPLGMGYPVALGMALADQLDGKERYVYAILGDGELNEGIIWEAALNVTRLNACNLISIVDLNGVQLDGLTKDILPMGDLRAKFEAFGYQVLDCDGHDMNSICEAIQSAKRCKEKPTMILAHTIKGKGVSFMEGKNTWHGKPIDDESYKRAIAELEA